MKHLVILQLHLLFSLYASGDSRPQHLSTVQLETDRVAVREISREEYARGLQGFWLGQCIANWTGLITEMDKIEAPFYTDADWGTDDQPAYWGEGVPHSDTIDFYFVYEGEPWGADDDTDIEYMYQHLLYANKATTLTGEQIRDGWLKHIYSNEDAPLYKKFPDSEPEKENFLWVSNERARELMVKGMTPPETSLPENNPDYDMIDAQLTTELFGLLAPARPDIALKLAELPIRTTAFQEAEWIAEFYVIMHSLVSSVNPSVGLKEQTQWLAEQARQHLPEGSYPAAMYDFVKSSYEANPHKDDWETTRDELYERFQKNGEAGYTYKQPFDAGINFGASLVSWFYGEGDMMRTIQIGSLCGWDSDNPTATWGGLLGFMIGPDGIEKAFQEEGLSDTYWITRTRRNFPDYTPNQNGEDSFEKMSSRALEIIDRVVVDEAGGSIDLEKNSWIIPSNTVTSRS